MRESSGPFPFPSTHTLTLTYTRAYPKGSRSLPEAFARQAPESGW